MKLPAVSLLLLAAAGATANAQPAVRSVVNGASFEPALSSGCLISIFGTSLARELVAAAVLPLPVQLGTTSVSIDGTDIPLYFATPGQINAQIPFGITKRTVALVVRTVAGTSKPYSLSLLPAAPGIFTRSQDGKGRALAFDADFHDLTRVGDDTFIFYATGLGATNPPATAGNPGADTEPLNRIANPIAITIGGQPAKEEYAGLAPGFAGVYQINVRAAAVRSSNLLSMLMRGSQSNLVNLPTAAGTIDATGKITALYPTAAIPPLSHSPLLAEAQFEIRVTIPADGQIHTVAAVSEGGQALLTFKPDGTYDGSLAVPTAPARQGDFSSSGFTPLDFLGGNPFPGAVIPAARIDPGVFRAIQALPLPNVPGSVSANGVVMVGGSYTPGLPFVIDSRTNSHLSAFGGFINLPVPVVTTQRTSFRLFADGQQIASQDIDYPVVAVAH